MEKPARLFCDHKVDFGKLNVRDNMILIITIMNIIVMVRITIRSPPPPFTRLERDAWSMVK